MPRLFVALPLPSAMMSALADIQHASFSARWQTAAQLHLTLAFLGEVEAHAIDDIADSLAGISAAPLTLALMDVGHFAEKQRVHSLWVGVEPSGPVGDLAARVATALRRNGFSLEARKFIPHVTVARLAASPEQIAPWLAAHGDFATPSATIRRFGLYESTLGSGGAHYSLLAGYPLDLPS